MLKYIIICLQIKSQKQGFQGFPSFKNQVRKQQKQTFEFRSTVNSQKLFF